MTPTLTLTQFANTLTEQDRFEQALGEIMAEASLLLLSKHRDYGPTNIANAPGGALNGLRVRIHDKQARLNHLTDTGANPQHESMRDTVIDMLNYCAIWLMVVDGHWPGVEASE